MIDYSSIIGKSVESVRKEFPDICFRISSMDNRPMILTRDFKVNRVNLAIVDGIILSFEFG